MNVTDRIPLRIANTLLNSLKGGVVPRTGLGYITVGRKDEIDALLNDIEMISEGGASFRFVVGKYGAGKSFLLQTIRNYAMERGFVVVDADLSPERRLVGNKGDGLATYKELMKNLSTQTSPDGGALSLLLSKWINALKTEVMTENSLTADSEKLNGLVEIKIHQTINELETIVHGFDFARIISLYWKAVVTEDEELKSRTLKWLRGEYGTKTEAKAELGVGVIINDDDWYEYLKLFAAFLRQAGYAGMLIFIDELVNIYKIPHAITRQYNYEKILTMYNDAMQGRAKYLGMVLCGTPACMEDTRRGVYSYEALRSRLAEGRFAGEHRDLLSPVIKLSPLTHEEMLVLVEKLSGIHAELYGYETTVTQEDLADFIRIEFGRIGADDHITPREVIRDFIQALDIIYQTPTLKMADLLLSENFSYAANAVEGAEVSAQFAEFDL